MKKICLAFTLFAFVCVCAQARPYTEVAAGRIWRAAEKQNLRRASRRVQEPQLIRAARKGDAAQVRGLLALGGSTPGEADFLFVTDAYGNNVFHAAANEEVFEAVWAYAGPQERERLLRQRNLSGETPLMTFISYGRAGLFKRYFPRTDLYKRLKETAAGLENAGLDGKVSQIKRDELVKECSFAGQTMWQRADFFYRQATKDTDRAEMQKLRDEIGAIAPFLIR